MKKEDYVARIAAANPLQLVMINYELVLLFLSEAEAGYDDEQVWRAQLDKARNAVDQLAEGLNFAYELAHDLFDLYVYVNKLLNTASAGHDREAGREAADILSKLMASWEEIEKTHPDLPPVMENAQQVYAGLTYKNGELSEYVEDDGKRGYTV